MSSHRGFQVSAGLRPSDFGLRISRSLSAAVLALMSFATVRAQPVTLHIGYVFPAGGRQGSVVQVAVGGQYLKNATNAYVSGTGVKAVSSSTPGP